MTVKELIETIDTLGLPENAPVFFIPYSDLLDKYSDELPDKNKEISLVRCANEEVLAIGYLKMRNLCLYGSDTAIVKKRRNKEKTLHIG